MEPQLTPDGKLDFAPINLSCKKNENKYFITMSVANDSELVLLDIHQEFNTVYWEKSFNYSSLLKENPKWYSFDNIQDILNYIKEDLENCTFQITHQYLEMIYTNINLMGKKKIITIYKLKCDSKVQDIDQSLNSLSSTVQEIKQDVDSIKEKLNLVNIKKDDENKELINQISQKVDTLYNKIEDHSVRFIEVRSLIDTKVNSLQNEIVNILEKINLMERNLVQPESAHE